MNNSPTLMRELRQSVAAGASYIKDDLTASFRKHSTDTIIPALNAVLKALSGEIQQQHSLVTKDESDIPEYFIHYTSVNTIVAIIQAQVDEASRSGHDAETSQPKDARNLKPRGGLLRLYDSAHFNDPDEGNYLANQLLNTPRYDWLKQSTTTHAYISSFIIPNDNSKPEDARDNLVFWRTYGREGEGCSLQLRVDPTKLSRVSYNKDELQNTIERLRPIADILTPISLNAPSDIQQEIRDVFWKALGRIKYLYKSEAYEYEQECRYIIPASDIEDDSISFEYKYEGGSTGQLRHYCENRDLDIARILATGCSITIGPCISDEKDLKASLKILLNRAEMSGPKVFTSGISYRKT